MNDEIWKDVVGYEGSYRVSNVGRIYSINRNRIMISNPSTLGYCKINLYSIDGSYKTKKVHRLVADAFIPNPDNKPEVNHIDRNRSNNEVTNLEWVSHRDNSIHAHILRKKKTTLPGVGKCNRSISWFATAQINGKAVIFGRFKTELEAYKAYLIGMEANGIVNKYNPKINEITHGNSL